MTDAVLEVDGLSVTLGRAANAPAILRDVSFKLAPRSVLAIVGESGSGKSTVARAVVKLLEPPLQMVSGSVCFLGTDLSTLSEKAMARDIRGNAIGFVFQDPMTALNPVISVGAHLSETVRAHQSVSSRTARRMAVNALRDVGIPEPEARYGAYPHELSGGMRQRVSIAAAMINEPSVLIADEPTTALDVSVQAQIIALVADLSQRRGTAVIWISHDLAVVANLAQHLLVMYGGEVVECGPAREVLRHPQHDYTRMLLSCVPTGPRELRRLRPYQWQPIRARSDPTGTNA